MYIAHHAGKNDTFLNQMQKGCNLVPACSVY